MAADAQAFLLPGNELFLIADQLQRVYKGPSWLGPSLRSLLSKVSEEQAARRPIAGAHTIWEIVLHLATWSKIARERLTLPGERDPTPEEDWPRTDGPWKDALAVLDRQMLLLQDAILAFPLERLHEPAPASEPQSFYVLLHGIVQHLAYHAGQIAILIK